MFSKLFGPDFAGRVLAPLITAGVLAVVRWAWPMVPTEYRILLILGGLLIIVLTWIFALLYKRIKRSINLRSGLVIDLKDINCWVRVYRRNVMGARKYVESGIEWKIGCIVEIVNKRKLPMTDINGTLKLVLGKNDFDYSYPLNTFGLNGYTPRKLFVPFGPTILKFPVETSVPPDIPYRLVFTYTYTIDGTKIASPHRTRVSGKLKKSDWIGQADELWMFRRLGFPDPSKHIR